MSLLIEALSQLWWRFPIALFALACTIVAILRNARHPRVTPPTATERQLWYLPACVTGFEGVGNLSYAMRCHFGLTPEQMTNDFLLAAFAMAMLIVVAVIVGTIGQSVASHDPDDAAGRSRGEHRQCGGGAGVDRIYLFEIWSQARLYAGVRRRLRCCV